jgi:hypothetical protein
MITPSETKGGGSEQQADSPPVEGKACGDLISETECELITPGRSVDRSVVYQQSTSCGFSWKDRELQSDQGGVGIVLMSMTLGTRPKY